MLGSELEQLVAHLRRLDRAVADLLRPGIDAEQVRVALGVPRVPPSVLEWFEWCDGVEVRPGQLQDEVNVIPGYNPLSLEEAIHIAPMYQGDPVLGERFLPLLTSASGDIYSAVWSESDDDAKIAGVIVGEPTEIEFTSIEQMVSIFNACFENGTFYVNDVDRLVMNPNGYEETYADVTNSQ